jgi:hypothetical protein
MCAGDGNQGLMDVKHVLVFVLIPDFLQSYGSIIIFTITIFAFSDL